MKFCENCGTQLADDATFCEECGTKQDVQEVKETPAAQPKVESTSAQDVLSNVATQVENMIPKLSETCTPAKREIKGWLMILLLIVCSPLILVNLIAILPDFLFWIVFVGAQLAVLALMWKKRTWKIWIKLAVTAAYVLMYII